LVIVCVQQLGLFERQWSNVVDICELQRYIIYTALFLSSFHYCSTVWSVVYAGSFIKAWWRWVNSFSCCGWTTCWGVAFWPYVTPQFYFVTIHECGVVMHLVTSVCLSVCLSRLCS